MKPLIPLLQGMEVREEGLFASQRLRGGKSGKLVRFLSIGRWY
tara:strand:+ start:367 stop:495 length:129 start_codon:yes stop_codon:yes gene_type:complete